MLLKLLIGWYKDEDPLDSIHGTDLIVPLSYTTLRDRLTNGTRGSLLRALAYSMQFPNAAFAFSNASHAFNGSEEAEYRFKKEFLGSTTPHVLCARSCINSVQEAEEVKRVVPFPPRKILIVCGEAHSRSARIIWQKVFPNAEIRIHCMPFALEYQHDFPFFVERYAWIWFAASITREILLRMIGIERMRSIKHTASS